MSTNEKIIAVFNMNTCSKLEVLKPDSYEDRR